MVQRSLFIFGLVTVLALGACNNGGDIDCEGPQCDPIPENQPPVPTITGPKSVNPGTPVTLDASDSTDPEGGKLRFLWSEGANNPPNNFLNGVDLTAAKITFTPDEVGSYEYSVRVKDAQAYDATATFTLVVKEGTVIGGTNTAPKATSITVNGRVFPLPGPAPTVFTTATAKLDVSIQGTDTEDAASALVQVFSANVTEAAAGPGKRYSVASEYKADRDDDEFGRAALTVKLKDSDGASVGPYTVNVRIVPAASADLRPRAVFVDCIGGIDDVGRGLSMAAPLGTLQAGYDMAVTTGIRDVWVGLGTCQGAQVDFTAGVRLWGLFDPLDLWRRRTEGSDRAVDKLAGAGHKHAARSRIHDPMVQELLFTEGAGSSTGSLKIDGFSFDLAGENLFGISVTTTTPDSVNLTISNNEFVGNAKSMTTRIAATWVPGGVLVVRGVPSSGTTYFVRNLFAVRTTDGTSRMQAQVDASPRTTSAGAIHFYANVVSASMSATPIYTCAYSGVYRYPFALCFYQNASDNPSPRVNLARNTFWASALTNVVMPVMVDVGKGRLNSYGNLFSNKPSPFTIRIAHVNDNASADNPDGRMLYSAFPVTNTSNYLIVTTLTPNTTGYQAAGYNCLLSGSFGVRTPSCASATSAVLFPSAGSFEYVLPDLTPGSSQPWRFQLNAANDLFVEADIGAPFFDPAVLHDFDGVYGPIDNTSSGTPKFNAGAFESLP